jgi:hypothetical protein
MDIDLDEVGRLREARLVSVVRDPYSDLVLINYTPYAQFGREWEAHPILLWCRGTIL